VRYLLAVAMVVSACSTPQVRTAEPNAPPPRASTARQDLDGDCRAPWSGPAKHTRFNPSPSEVHVSGGRLVLPASPAESAYSHAADESAANRWDRAASEFRALALAHPESEIGVYAAERYVHAANMLRVEADRPSCLEDIRRDLPRLLALYCGQGHAANESVCNVLVTMGEDLERGAAP
jgi:hypothetical protein